MLALIYIVALLRSHADILRRLAALESGAGVTAPADGSGGPAAHRRVRWGHCRRHPRRRRDEGVARRGQPADAARLPDERLRRLRRVLGGLREDGAADEPRRAGRGDHPRPVERERHAAAGARAHRRRRDHGEPGVGGLRRSRRPPISSSPTATAGSRGGDQPQAGPSCWRWSAKLADDVGEAITQSARTTEQRARAG